jgi:hypothetical protein
MSPDGRARRSPAGVAVVVVVVVLVPVSVTSSLACGGRERGGAAGGTIFYMRTSSAALRLPLLALAVVIACPAVLALDAPDGKPAAPEGPAWRELFDGKSLDGWKQSGYGGELEATVADGALTIPMADRLSGVTYAGDDELPTTNYEVEVEARRVAGTDFFVGLTFPVGDSHASLILGGWGGSVCGISSLDGEDANDNATRKLVKFKKGQWYTARVRVEPQRIQVWLDGEPLIDADTTGKRVGIRLEVGPSRPLGLATFATTAEVKHVRLREMPAAEKQD